MKSQKARLACCAFIAACALPASAAITTADIEATAGLAPVLSMTCTPVNFGVWRVPVRNSGGPTNVALLTTSDTPMVTGNTANGVALATNAGWGAARGQCTLTGSAAPDGVTVLGSIDNGSLNMGADATSPYSGLSAPATAISGLSVILSPANASTIASGSTVIYVGGELNIPQDVATANYGAYRTLGVATVTADDQQ